MTRTCFLVLALLTAAALLVIDFDLEVDVAEAQCRRGSATLASERVYGPQVANGIETQANPYGFGPGPHAAATRQTSFGPYYGGGNFWGTLGGIIPVGSRGRRGYCGSAPIITFGLGGARTF
jgi:hypothetical protein